MEEPSVLDYVKSKLAFWKRSAPVERDSYSTASEYPDPDGVPESHPIAPLISSNREPESVAPLPPPDSTPRPTAPPAATNRGLESSGRFPWLAIGPLLLALVAQALLEPPDRVAPLAAALYLVCAAVIEFAYVRRRMAMADLPADAPRPGAWTVRWEGLLIGVVLMLATFLFFGAPKGQAHNFNAANTLLWLLSIGYIVWALWEPRDHPIRAWLGQLPGAVRQPVWKLSISRWAVLLVVVVGIVLFYRFYRLETLPAEMVSDHAEKLLDVQDVLNGQYHVFFPRNTGREFFQFYWTALMVVLLDIPVSFMALKMGTVLTGLVVLLYIYRLGFELGNRWVALFALAFCGISYWANIMSRIGLRFPLYPFFTAPLLFYLLRGLRQMDRNDFIKAGLWLGLGLHGYTAYRVVPLLVVLGVGLYILHHKDSELRKRAFYGLAIIALVSLAVFMPLARFAVDDPQMFIYRSLTRVGESERPLPGPAPVIFARNTWNALTMFFYDDGDVWVHSITHRPALDIVSAALMFIGMVMAMARYLQRRDSDPRHWVDLFLLLSIPLLLLPSIMSLAFPNENPNLNRTAAAYIPAFMLVGMGLDALFKHVSASLPGKTGVTFASVLGVVLFGWSAWQNYDLLFVQYDQSFRGMSWNSTEMGQSIREFESLTGSQGNAYVVAYPYWVDTRLVGVESGHPDRDLAIAPDRLADTQASREAKLFVLNREDTGALNTLMGLYPEGRFWVRPSRTPTKDFILFMVPPADNNPLVDPNRETQ